jgi:drug/metabolite transporter (DMT)-like permease
MVAEGLVWLAVPVLESPFTLPALPLTWVALVWLGVLGSCVAYLLYFNLIQQVGSTRATMVTYLMPLVGVALGVLFLQEPFTLGLAAGAALVLFGVWVVNKST